jgi:hypothetical protein
MKNNQCVVKKIHLWKIQQYIQIKIMQDEGL